MPRALMRQGVGQEPPMRERMQLDLELSPAINSLSELAKAENECTRCPLYKHATQAVPGEGRRSAHVMLVGEQPGDKGDIAGKPFVRPARRRLDRARAAARMSPSPGFLHHPRQRFKPET